MHSVVQSAALDISPFAQRVLEIELPICVSIVGSPLSIAFRAFVPYFHIETRPFYRPHLFRMDIFKNFNFIEFLQPYMCLIVSAPPSTPRHNLCGHARHPQCHLAGATRV